MKSCLQIILIFNSVLLFTSSCRGQQQSVVSSDSTFTIRLDEYKIDTCLLDILSVIVEADSNHVRFPPNLYFYQLQFSNFTTYRNMVITPARWKKYLPKDCTGSISVGGMKFLCMGNFSKDALFKKTGKTLALSINIVTSKISDSLDRQSNWFDWEKSSTAVVGKFSACVGPPIDIYVNNGIKLEGLHY